MLDKEKDVHVIFVTNICVAGNSISERKGITRGSINITVEFVKEIL